MTNCNVLAIYFLLFLNYNQTPDPSPKGEGQEGEVVRRPHFVPKFLS